MDVRAEMLVFSRISRAWPKFLPPDVRRDIRVDVRRISGPKTYSLGCFLVPDFKPIIPGFDQPCPGNHRNWLTMLRLTTEHMISHLKPLRATLGWPQTSVQEVPEKAVFVSFVIPKDGHEFLVSPVSRKSAWKKKSEVCWEVLNGVGVDGVGVIFPFFYAFFALLRIFSLFFVFLRFSLLLLLLKDKGKQQQFTAKIRKFTPTPSALTPCKTSRGWRNADNFGCDLGVNFLGGPSKPWRNKAEKFAGTINRRTRWEFASNIPKICQDSTSGPEKGVITKKVFH